MQRLCCLMSQRLDYPKFQAQIFHTIKRINKNGVPILLVEQNAKQALEIADKGYVLVDGANKVEGSGQDLINDQTWLECFWKVKNKNVGNIWI